jgi:hypothetical protein
MGKIYEKTSHQKKKNADGKRACDKMLNIACHWGISN